MVAKLFIGLYPCSVLMDVFALVVEVEDGEVSVAGGVEGAAVLNLKTKFKTAPPLYATDGLELDFSHFSDERDGVESLSACRSGTLYMATQDTISIHNATKHRIRGSRKGCFRWDIPSVLGSGSAWS